MRRLVSLPLAVGLLGLAGLAGLAGSSSAATASVNAAGARVHLEGGTAVAGATFTAATPTVASRVSVCVWDEQGRNADFAPQRDVELGPEGVAFTGRQSLAPGTYHYWPCALVDGSWLDLGSASTVVVGGLEAPSGQSMPVGDLAGWQQVLAEDFAVDAPRGRVEPLYTDSLEVYEAGIRDTAGRAVYDPARVLSVSDSVLRMHLHTHLGVPRSAVVVPDGWEGQTYGRYSVRFRADPVPGYGLAFLLWPTDNLWERGEIDFPEGPLTGAMQAFNHCVGEPERNCLVLSPGRSFDKWTTATIEWTPTRLSFWLDGVEIGATVEDIPSSPMRWTLQSGSQEGMPPPSAKGDIEIDWVVVYEWGG